jgi:hypothetical protein
VHAEPDNGPWPLSSGFLPHVQLMVVLYTNSHVPSPEFIKEVAKQLVSLYIWASKCKLTFKLVWDKLLNKKRHIQANLWKKKHVTCMSYLQ